MKKILLFVAIICFMSFCKKDDARFKIQYMDTKYGVHGITALANRDHYIITSDFDVTVKSDGLLWLDPPVKIGENKYEYFAVRDVHATSYTLTVSNTNGETLTYNFKGRAGRIDDWR